MRASANFVPRLSFIALAGLLLSTTAAAQTGLATVTGIVSDESGGAVPGLTVTAVNQATNIAYTGVTNAAGNYIITSVPIGGYVITADLPGFKGAQSTVTLSAGQTARVDFKLKLGAVEERVEVVATGAVLQTENAVVGSIVDRDQIEKLPVQGRAVSTVTLYTAGATQPSPESFNSLRGVGRPFVNGQLQQSNNFTLDGVDTNEAINNGIAYQPSPDAVEQVSVETLNYSAELGNVAGAVVNMVIKSGTNQFRGNAFEYLARQQARGNALDHQPPGRQEVGVLAQHLRRHDWRPDLRNKVFFFGDYQGGRDETPPTDAFATVVPDEWRRGDLSDLLARGLVIRDPLTGQPFPNNQIPVSRFSTFARNLFADESLYPRPNVARPLSDFRDNYRGTTAAEGSDEPVRREGGLERVVAGQAVRPVFETGGGGKQLADGDAAGVHLRVQQSLMERGRELEPDHRRGGGERPAGRVQRHLIPQRPGRPPRARPAEQPVGYQRSTGRARPLTDTDRQQHHQHRQRRDRDEQLQRGVPDQRAADMVARPPHAEVRRVVELLPE